MLFPKYVFKCLFPHRTWTEAQKIPRGNFNVLHSLIFYYKNKGKPKGWCACKRSSWNSNDKVLPRETFVWECKGPDATVLIHEVSILFHVKQKVRKRCYALALLTISLIFKIYNKAKGFYNVLERLFLTVFVLVRRRHVKVEEEYVNMYKLRYKNLKHSKMVLHLGLYGSSNCRDNNTYFYGKTLRYIDGFQQEWGIRGNNNWLNIFLL